MGLLNRVGIGSATVDTILETDTVQPGGSVGAHVEIEGGSDDQEVDELELAVATEYRSESDEGPDYVTTEIAEMELTEGFTIEAGEERTMEVPPIDIPIETPPTLGRTSVWIQTGLEIDWSVDPSDRDELRVEPDAYLAALLEAVEGLGFVRDGVDNVRSRFGPGEFAQAFEYEDRGRTPFSNLDDIEFQTARYPDRLEVALVVEAQRSGLLESDESRTTLTVDSTDVDAIQADLRTLVDQNL